VVIAEDNVVWGDGIDWHSTYLVAWGGINYGRVWMANQYLLDDPNSPGPTPPPGGGTPPSGGTLQFTSNPVAGPYRYMGGFGANQFAYDECNDKGADCPYKLTRGLHNGIDFGVPVGTSVVWTAALNGTVLVNGVGDSTPNVTVDAGGYRVVFGHLSQIAVNNGQEVKAGTVLGRSGEFKGDAHLHMGLINYSPYSFHNPASFFDSSIRASWPSIVFL
jgi:murein DD-endopeptidase MepM/ murein hydrolase activator NlpD